MKSRFKTEADFQKEYKSHSYIAIEPQVDPVTRVFNDSREKCPNPDNELIPGQFVRYQS